GAPAAAATPDTACLTHRRRRQRGRSGAGVAYCTASESSGDMVPCLFIGVDNAGNQGVPDDIAAGESGGGDALHGFQHVDGMDQATGLAAGQVDLRGVAVDDGLAAETDA